MELCLDAEQATCSATESTLMAEIEAYWNDRAASFGADVADEFAGGSWKRWAAELMRLIPGFGTRQLRVLDVGCGPAFFSILAAHAGCVVCAVDASSEMLEQARRNVRAHGVSDWVTLARGNALRLPFPDASFDVVVTRNLTWTLEDPASAYAEWLRVLAPQGRLVNFDANWYRYLVDGDAARVRPAEEAGYASAPNCHASESQCARCEQIALELPLTRVERPAWDVDAMRAAGFRNVTADPDCWRRVLPAADADYYGGTAPTFSLVGEK